MRIRSLQHTILSFSLLLLGLGTAHAQRNVAADDHPLLRRAVGSRIADKDVKEFGTCDLPVGPVSGDRFSKTREWQGRVTTITYDQRQGRSIGDVYRELETQLSQEGMRVLYTCQNGRCGSGSGPSNFCAPAWRGRNGQRQLTGVIERNNQTVVVSLHVQAPDNPERAVAHLTVIEPSVRQGVGSGVAVRKPGTVSNNRNDAAWLATLNRGGRVTLREPIFQPATAQLRSDAGGILSTLAQFLNRNPGVRIVVVNASDTDRDKTFDLMLSQARAKSLADALTSRYGIASNRVASQGIAGPTPSGDSQTAIELAR
jgi:outer membrane protein OmpA-like peptidoglycan-associated protein